MMNKLMSPKYITPLCEVIELRPEGIIASSNIEDLKDGGKLW